LGVRAGAISANDVSIDAMQSAERTGVPSWNFNPSRSVNV